MQILLERSKFPQSVAGELIVIHKRGLGGTQSPRVPGHQQSNRGGVGGQKDGLSGLTSGLVLPLPSFGRSVTDQEAINPAQEPRDPDGRVQSAAHHGTTSEESPAWPHRRSNSRCVDGVFPCPFFVFLATVFKFPLSFSLPDSTFSSPSSFRVRLIIAHLDT